MIVEHTFVTTLGHEDALLLADGLLTHMGFARVPGTTDEWSAGKDRVRKASDIRRRAKVEFDRGRVSFAVSALTIVKAQEKLYQPYLVALANAMEAHVGKGVPVEEAGRVATEATAEWDRKDRRTRRNALIALGVVLLLILGVVILAILSP